MEVNEDDFASVMPSNVEQEHISGCCILFTPLYTKSRQMESALL